MSGAIRAGAGRVTDVFAWAAVAVIFGTALAASLAATAVLAVWDLADRLRGKHVEPWRHDAGKVAA